MNGIHENKTCNIFQNTAEFTILKTEVLNAFFQYEMKHMKLSLQRAGR